MTGLKTHSQHEPWQPAVTENGPGSRVLITGAPVQRHPCLPQRGPLLCLHKKRRAQLGGDWVSGWPSCLGGVPHGEWWYLSSFGLFLQEIFKCIRNLTYSQKSDQRLLMTKFWNFALNTFVAVSSLENRGCYASSLHRGLGRCLYQDQYGELCS